MNEYNIVKWREYKKGLLNPKDTEAPKELGLFLYAIVESENQAVQRVIYRAEGKNEGKWNLC